MMEGELPHVSHVCGDPDPVRDGAVLDPSSSGRNFEFVDQTANLYFTRFNYFYDGGGGCSMTLDRDLIKYPIQFSGAPPTATVTLEDLTGGSTINIDDAIELDASGSTDSDGSIVQYDWDMDGDGTYEIVNGGATRITGFAKVRDGEAAVRVHDNHGLQDETRIQLNIDARLDFKPSWAVTQSLYSPDTGAAYTDARGYGWVRQDSLPNPTHTPLDLSANTADRDPYDSDTHIRRLDTTIFMQYPTAGSNPRLVKTPGAFEIAVPCGVYAVTASVGDSAWSSLKRKPGDVSTHRVNAEGQTLIAGFTPTDSNKFSSATRTVSVCDGRLTIDAIGGTNTKLNYVDIERVVPKINFQPELAETPTDYAPDTGAAFSESRGYGWVRQDSLAGVHVPLDLSANTSDRDPYDSNIYSQQQDTTIFMQYPANGSNPRLVNTAGAFEVSLPCDNYQVTVSVGDAAWSSLKRKPGEVSTHRINIEGQNVIAGFVPNDSNKFATATGTVNVCDGRLTIDAIGGTNTKLNYVEIVRL